MNLIRLELFNFKEKKKEEWKKKFKKYKILHLKITVLNYSIQAIVSRLWSNNITPLKD